MKKLNNNQVDTLKMKKKIYITQPYLPPLEEYVDYLENIWDSKVVTNGGQYVSLFEKELAKKLDVRFVTPVCSGTMGLLVALQSLDLSHGEVITTPFSFVATSHAIDWLGLKPVFADVDNITGNLDPNSVEKLISNKTKAILAVHNFGIPENVNTMQSLSQKYKLPLIYDSAPGLGVKYKSQSIFKFGDLSIASFHGTKVLTTFEGGMIVSNKKEHKEKIDLLINFSLKNNKVFGLGINAKMNEVQASMGLLQLKYLDKSIKARKEIYNYYYENLSELNFLKFASISADIDYNYSYCTLFFDNSKILRDRVYHRLKENNIFCRRYWYPLITDHDYYSESNDSLKIAKKLSKEVLNLPIYPNLDFQDIDRIIKIIKSF